MLIIVGTQKRFLDNYYYDIINYIYRQNAVILFELMNGQHDVFTCGNGFDFYENFELFAVSKQINE